VDDASAFAYVEMSENTTSSAASSSSVVVTDSDAANVRSAPPAPSAAELAWLRRCLPIFVQPEVDVANGNGLVKVFFRFERDDMTGRLDCKLCVVLAGEASYNRVWATRENLFATLMYRTFNRRTYKRTADINYMDFRCVLVARPPLVLLEDPLTNDRVIWQRRGLGPGQHGAVGIHL
jgi:hypothetical protein